MNQIKVSLSNDAERKDVIVSSDQKVSDVLAENGFDPTRSYLVNAVTYRDLDTSFAEIDEAAEEFKVIQVSKNNCA
ncbi:MAG: hypothetical protein NC084_06345 [Bacteroides sp.]|nr:hypothetical protein [Eubacterium sp.]MCM1418156.1 hypothetical protein [Roseburia sp.]MCM1462319.1 hypothetical protein [Bacteroides sp.]